MFVGRQVIEKQKSYHFAMIKDAIFWNKEISNKNNRKGYNLFICLLISKNERE